MQRRNTRAKLPPKVVEPEPASILFEQITPNVHKATFCGVRAGWEGWVLLSSDRHNDNIKSNRDLQLRHLEQLKERNGLGLDFGDLFDAMQQRGDNRSNRDEIRPEDNTEKYFDSIVEHSAEFYAPYARWLRLFSRGNHESSALKYHGMDLTNNLVYRINTHEQTTGTVYRGGYGGWVMLQFNIRDTVRVTKRLKYFHGSGGGGQVTKGVISTNRQAVYQPDADIVVNGHTHDNWHLPLGRERINQAGVVSKDLIHFIRLPSYKDEYRDGADGWHVERWGEPKPIGAVWLRFYLDPLGDLQFDVISAVV